MITGLSPLPSNGKADISTKGEIQSSNGTLDKDDFLQLLVAQLQAQDPTNPMEAQDFSAQLAQFSTVEGIFNINSNLEALQATQTANNNNAIVNLIGKTVDSPGNGINLIEGQTATLNYALPENSDSVIVEIFDSTGTKVSTITAGKQSSGNNSVTWPGNDSEGDPLPSDTYSYSVSALDKTGKAMNVEKLSKGLVTEVTFENDTSYALVNGSKIPTSSITRVGLN